MSIEHTQSGAENAPSRSSDVVWRLIAVAFADVAGYSRLMAADSVATVRMWNRVCDEILLPNMTRHTGRLAGTAGDAILVEFPSAVRAVNWAVDVQQALLTHDSGLGREAIRLRIGINVDDVIDESGELHSDGVNIASRIHQFANPGEIVLTGLARDLVSNRLPISYRDLGTPPLKNIDRPVHVYAVEAKRTTRSGGKVVPYRDWYSRPTLAVLPFRNLSGNEEDRYFGEGITEDIIAGVSRSRSLFVIARSSTLQFGDIAKDPQTVATALGVKYLLTGSVRRQTNRLRINAELIEVEHVRAVWAERYDGDNKDLFDFQDSIVSRIVAALEPRVREAETARIGNRPTNSLDAYDCVLKALSYLYRFSPEYYEESLALLRRAVQLAPDYAQAHAYLAWCLNFWIGEGRSRDIERDRHEAVSAARLAQEIDPEDVISLSVYGHIKAFIERNPLEATGLYERALERDANSPLAWGLSAVCYAYLGDGNETRERLRNVWRLSPYDPLSFFFWTTAGIGEFVEGRYEEAVAWLKRSYNSKPKLIATLRLLSATLALSGNTDEARHFGRELLDAEPGFRISEFIEWYPLQREEDRVRLEKGLSDADLPN